MEAQTMAPTMSPLRTSRETEKIDAALAKAQAKIKRAVRNATNPHFKSKFADLESVFEACRGPLTEAGIATIQAPSTTTDGAVVVTTRLAHAGQFYEADLSSKPAQAGPQAVGSVVTYLKRYGLAAMAGVPTGDDDDAEAAEDHERVPHSNGKAAQSAGDKVREQMKTPAFRKQEAIKALAAMGLDVRAEVAHVVGRTFPSGDDIRLQNEDELAKLEAHVVMRKAQSNKERAEAH
jgi:hypothetical protein